MINHLKPTIDTYLKLLLMLLVASLISACASKAKKPEIVINSAGISNIDFCEKFQKESYKNMGSIFKNR